MFEPENCYNSIFFSGAGYSLPFHLGVAKCFQDNKISFAKTYGISSGGLAALCMLGGADLELTIRQIFDLPKNAVYFSWSYTFNVLLAYFEKSRKKNKLPLSKINDNLNIGLMDLKKCKRFFKNKFTSEDDLKHSMVLSANVVPFISLKPVGFESGWFVDPLMIDPKLGSKGFDVAVTPFPFSFHLPDAKVSLNGDANFLKVLNANETRMKNLFYDGYRKAKATVKHTIFPSSAPSFPVDVCPSKALADIKERHKNWKRETGYIYKEKTRKGKFREVEVVVPENKWDEFLLMMKRKKILRVCFLVLIAILLYWSLLY